ncbi:MAG: hypothetical protein HQK72_02000 [Desulfamplus sp.]|nr:hypothetical protein [Desulfamplus sp.]
MKLKVYIETSVVSYLTGRPSRDLIVAARQQQTHDWWYNRVKYFDIFISNMVLDEATIENTIRDCGYECSVICTPEELMEINYEQ